MNYLMLGIICIAGVHSAADDLHLHLNFSGVQKDLPNTPVGSGKETDDYSESCGVDWPCNESYEFDCKDFKNKCLEARKCMWDHMNGCYANCQPCENCGQWDCDDKKWKKKCYWDRGGYYSGQEQCISRERKCRENCKYCEYYARWNYCLRDERCSWDNSHKTCSVKIKKEDVSPGIQYCRIKAKWHPRTKWIDWNKCVLRGNKPWSYFDGFFRAESSSLIGKYHSAYAIDYSNNKEKFFYSQKEDNPWIELSMPKQYIWGLRISVLPCRASPCVAEFRDIEIRAGLDPVPNSYKLGETPWWLTRKNRILKHNIRAVTYAGPANRSNPEFELRFDPILAKYVTLQKIGHRTILSISRIFPYF